MNRIRFTLILILISISSHSQIDIGIKGGLNLNFSKEANIIGDFNFPNNSENALGFHFGIMAEFEIQKLGVILRPEILYTNVNYNYTDLIDLGSQSLTIQKIDIPLLFAIKIKGPLRLLIGPSLEFILNTDFDINEFKEIDNDNFSLNAQIGIGLKFERFDVDLRWERGLSKVESNFVTDIANVGVNFDTRPNQLILGVAYRFGIK
jgi:Outer membrane protein beta-barrel domain